MKIHHIGYLVTNMQKSIERFESLGFQISQNVKYDEYRKIDICFMKNEGYTVELIESKASDSTVANLKKKYGVSPYHICYYSDNLEDDIDSLRKQNYVPMGEMMPAPAMDGKKVAFLFHSHMGIIELVET